MVVDDDPSVRDLLRLTLPVDGFEVVEAGDGMQALGAARQRRLDLVLLDWRMPGASGHEVLRELKRREPDLPVIVLTAEPASALRDVARSLGADEFLTKPFSPLELLGAVERFLPA